MEIFGWIGTAVVSIQFIPQLLKSIKTKRVKDLSMTMIVLILFGAIMWIAHGYIIQDMPILVTNLFVAIVGISLLFVKLKYK